MVKFIPTICPKPFCIAALRTTLWIHATGLKHHPQGGLQWYCFWTFLCGETTEDVWRNRWFPKYQERTYLIRTYPINFRRLVRSVLREAFLRDCFAFSWTASYTSSCRNNPYHILVYMCYSISCDQLKMICTIYIYVSSVLDAIGYHFILRIRCPSLQYSGKPHLKCKKKVQHIGGEFRTFKARQKKSFMPQYE